MTSITPALSAIDSNSCLSIQDQDRASRFRFAKDRLRFVLGRRLLGTMLHDCGGSPPRQLNLAQTEYGRPYLAEDPSMTFSISHAGDVVAVALATDAQVGLDVESLDRCLELGPLAERIFNGPDLAHFRALPDAEKSGAFFRAWTGKEAVLKAKGVGLFGGLRETALSGDGATARTSDPTENPATIWRLQPLPVPEGYLGTVAWDNPDKAVRFRIYTSADLV